MSMTMLASGFPIGDAQFWLVTIIGALALGFLLRGLWPSRWKRRPRSRGKKATLTVKGQPLTRQPPPP